MHSNHHAHPQITALKNLGLNIRGAKVNTAGTTFFITDADTSEKIVKSARLEDIRMTVLNSLVAKFPVSRPHAVVVVPRVAAMRAQDRK